MIVLKPHTVTVYQASVTAGDDGIARTPSYSNGQEVRCQITPLTQDKAMQMGFMELAQPHMLLADVTEESKFSTGRLVVYGARQFIVKGPPAIWNAESGTSCIQVVLEELEATVTV